MTLPILYSFRRCPYAIRARLAIQSACIQVELREILLRDKAPEFIDVSPSATVPCLVSDAGVIDESRDIMIWCLNKNDPEGWLDMPEEGHDIVDTIEGPFKTALDRYKYSTRYDGANKLEERDIASGYLLEINKRLDGQSWLHGDNPKFSDMATLPFIRQFANTDRSWFDAQDWSHLSAWLERFLVSEDFKSIMPKYPVWKRGDAITEFPCL